FSDSIAESKGTKETPSQITRNNGVGGGMAAGRMEEASSDRSIVQEDTFKSTSKPKTSRKTLGANRHVLAAPVKFPKDGVYIWCDPDGLWTIFWKGRQKLAIETIITTVKPVIVKNTVKSNTKMLETPPDSLEISSDPNSRIGIAQFTSVDDSVQFNILINDRSDPNSIFVGSLLNNPTQFPLKLNTRRLSQKVVTDVDTIKNKEPQGIVVPNKSGEAYSDRITAGACEHGSGGSGGNEVKKAKR
ncbi:MAG: hypothetical protein KAV87_68430, partial [Desulfobacteraceae bacterium]|nr:hypothetical protein [Desulfobacteraceae bacterium]